MIYFNEFLNNPPWNQPIELPDHHQWKHANQHALLEWKTKARPYNTTVANGMFVLMMIIALGACYLMFFKNNSSPLIEKHLGAQYLFLFFLVLYGTTHQKTLGLANSKQFQEMHSLYRHNVFTWNGIKHIYIDRSRHLISLEYEWLNENINKTLPWRTYIFCHKKDFETIVETIISKNINTPHTREKVEVLQF